MKRWYSEGVIEAGCDEAGRGCLAGPVFAAAVILPPEFSHPSLNDSKKLKEKDRDKLRPIIEKEAIAFSVQSIDSTTIDEINILNASILAMHRAVASLKTSPEFLLIDGNRFKAYADIPHKCIVKGDSIYSSIAAASILAKTYRDEYMVRISEEFPAYCWHQNKGYGTLQHRRVLQEIGPSKYHRKSFKVRNQISLALSDL